MADERHIEFRSDGVPIGDNASKFVNYFALLVRERVPCTIQNWKKVNVELKNEFWKDIKVYKILTPKS
jgi:ABC-type sulfate transport system substrate-binding protein